MLTRMAQKLAMVGLIDMASSGGQNPHHDSYQNPSKPTCSSWNPHHLGLLVTKIPKKGLKTWRSWTCGERNWMQRCWRRSKMPCRRRSLRDNRWVNGSLKNGDLVGGLEPWNFMTSISYIWDVIRNPLTNSYFSRWLKPPTSIYIYILVT